MLFFFFNDTATTEIYTLSLHDALPISREGGQRPSACISSRITTVIQVGEERATKGTITDLMSHSQFHCTGRAYLDMHGLIFETSICYWQDQPGRSAREPGRDRKSVV